MKLGTILLGIFKYLMLLGIIGYLGFALVKLVQPAQDQVCTGVEVQLHCDSTRTLISEHLVRHMLHKIPIKGQTFSEIDKNEINQLLNDSPLLDTAYCYLNSAGLLVIKAYAHTPVLHIINEQGENYYLSSQGTIMPSTELTPTLCVASGNISRTFAGKHLTQLGNILTEDEYWRLQAQQIYVDASQQLWLTTRIGDHKILLGSSKNIKDKLERIRLLYSKGLPQAGWNIYQTIDASYNGQLVCTKRKKKK